MLFSLHRARFRYAASEYHQSNHSVFLRGPIGCRLNLALLRDRWFVGVFSRGAPELVQARTVAGRISGMLCLRFAQSLEIRLVYIPLYPALPGLVWGLYIERYWSSIIEYAKFTSPRTVRPPPTFALLSGRFRGMANSPLVHPVSGALCRRSFDRAIFPRQ